MKDVDFIEIGTSDFWTIIESADDSIIGFSIDPLQMYLDNLPNKLNVKKCCLAITGKCEKNATTDVFFIPREKIIEYKLPEWFAGCNTIGNYHPMHIQHNVREYVSKLTVQMMSLGAFYDLHQIRGCKFLKIDTEGHDVVILDEFANYLKEKDSLYYPKKIQFESNELTDPKKVKDIVFKYIDIGYNIESTGYDTVLTLKEQIQS
jgi:hypothetical protein